MIRTINKKEKFIPIKKSSNNYYISWDFKEEVDRTYNSDDILIDEKPSQVGSWMVMQLNYKPTLDTIKNIILTWHNNQIDKKILSGFVWKDMQVWLSSENQFNYKASYDLAIQTNGANLPIKFKFGTTEEPIYYTFESVDDLAEFYISAMNFINTTLNEGWAKKDAINWEDYKI